jgi:alpha-amylase/alpha-mannosidase (GH57 family)
MERYICIHAHFYQPPRENPWLEAIEHQDSAYPYHDWNERITAECYATNTTSRILDERGRISQMVNNCAKISFNFGPTLLSWMEIHAPDVYKAILEADKESQRTFSGHGSAMAQAYNHMILPLANYRDKFTQILWGIRDFEHRFGREPEGMWLPETAVDLETLDLLADLGIRFTILAPHQAHLVRPKGKQDWQDVSEGKVDPTMVYELKLPSGRKIALFFYDGPISRAVAFEQVLKSGEAFAQRLLSAFNDKRGWPQMVHIATDGETYGHHHHFADMALAYALNYIEKRDLARLTNYAYYLEKHPPTHEVRIYENTSWSCVHGIERWRSDCGCNTGGHPDWNQGWREPLRQALDWLRDAFAPLYEEKSSLFFGDPWRARDDYIHIVLDRSDERVSSFLKAHARGELTEAEKIIAMKLMELQRHAMLMYTSCGWFFDELTGIETIQIIQYAARALQLAQEIFGDGLEIPFLQLLERAKSNLPEKRDGRQVFEKFVKPAMVNLQSVGAHYAMSSLFEDYQEGATIYCYKVEREDYQISEAGKAKLLVGRVRVASEITRESARLSFGVLHIGDHNLNCGVGEYRNEQAYGDLVKDIGKALDSMDFATTIRLMDKHFGASMYSLKSLFRDEQRRILGIILESTLADAEAIYRQVYENYAPMMRFIKDLGIPLPRPMYMAAEVVLNASLRRAFENEEPNGEIVKTLLEEANVVGITLDTKTLEYALRHRIEQMAQQLMVAPSELSAMDKLDGAVALLGLLPFTVNLWKIQNIFYEILQSVYPELKKRAGKGDKEAKTWVSRFTALGERLFIHVS